ncbi:MAG: hemolysin III family protein [Treponema sp.]|nr:hemolysin III family protein [Treponema sp.]
MSTTKEHATLQDEIASNAVRKSTLRSLKVKKNSRLKQLREDYENAVREVNLQYAQDPERLKARYAAADYAKSERARKRAEKKIEVKKKIILSEAQTRRLTLGEEIASAIVQGIGAIIFIAATAILDTVAMRDVTSFFNTTIVFYSLFGSSMILMYLFSLLRHALTSFTAKTVFNRLAHVFAYLVIGFGYSVYTITKLKGTTGWILFGIVWALQITGIFFYAIAGRKYELLNIIFTVIAGVLGVVVAAFLYRGQGLPKQSFTMLIFGGVFYLVGILFYNLKKIRYMHFISNLIMLFGSVYIFFSLFFINSVSF